MDNFISNEDVEKALEYLAHSAKPHAEWKSRMKWLEHKRKSVKSTVSLRQKGKSQAENSTKAEASPEYNQVLDEYKESVMEFTLIDSYRKAAELKIEIWRSLNANNRKGHL